MKKYSAFAIVSLVSLVADQWTKHLATQSLKPLLPGAKVVWQDWFELRFAENTGIAFSLFQDLAWGRVLLSLVGGIAVLFLFFFLRRPESSRKIVQVGLGLLAGGALGNLIDRIAHGRVVDFIFVRHGSFAWPLFNVADSTVVIGVFLLLLFGKEKK